MRLVVARCQVDYSGRLSAHLPMATRLIMVKSDGSVLIHADGGSYKPLNWMSPPCTLRESDDEGVLTGPALVEEPGTTTVVPPGVRAAVDPHANLVLERR